MNLLRKPFTSTESYGGLSAALIVVRVGARRPVERSNKSLGIFNDRGFNCLFGFNCPNSDKLEPLKFAKPEKRGPKPPQPLKRTRIKTARGKVFTSWYAFRKKYLKQNPPNHEGYYVCGICNLAVPAVDVTLDHIIARSKRPDLRFEPSNIQFAHYLCNSDKGSQ